MGLTKRPSRNNYRLTSEIPKTNQVKFGTKNMRVFGPKIWNSLPHQESRLKTNKI